jgi:ectoine hydroxylase-related dioxygenase (phytanoyl-CoA dioxygenase family)
MDFHNASLAGKLIALHPRVLGFLGHVFRETVVAMQTLTFIRGSEQSTHQDYAYVVPAIPSHLAATWVALEDVHADAGPLGYYPGSHTIRKFDWGNGLFLTEESLHDEHDFAAHIERECERMGLRRDVFLAHKGDVFFWHGALAHTGTGQTDPERTRRSLVTHYSSERGYPRDRRAPDDEPLRYELNGGLLYVDPRWPHAEDSFRSRADALDKPRGSKRGGLFRRLLGR